MPILSNLRTRVTALSELCLATDQARAALRTLLDHPHPLSERRRTDELQSRYQAMEEAHFAFCEELELSRREYSLAERALAAPVPAANAK
jgi:hypothetical protein